MNLSLPKVTIITATFNLIKDGREQFFRQCVESVNNQTYTNIEHIIIDGASTDGTLDLIREYEEKGWIKYYSEPDSGMVDAMNKGIKKASGKYIAILNSDDWYPDYAIEESVKKILETNSDYSYGITDCLCRDTGKLYKKWTVSPFNFACFYINMPYNHESMLCKKSVYEKLNYYNHQEYGTVADIDFAQRLILNDYKGCYIEKVILKFRWDGSTNFSKNKCIKQSCKEHIANLFKLYRNLWTSFIPDYLQKPLNYILDKDNSLNENKLLLLQQNWFMYPFIKWISEKQLKNFPYDALIRGLLHEEDLYNTHVISSFYKNYNINILGIIPFIKIKHKKGITRINLFDVLPILKTKTSNGIKTIYLFGILPLLRIKLK